MVTNRNMLGLAALLTISAVMAYRRSDNPSRIPTAAFAASLSVIVLGTVAVSGNNVLQQRNEEAAWRQAHQTYELHAVVDMKRIRGNVQIDPGRLLVIDLLVDFIVDIEQKPEQSDIHIQPRHEDCKPLNSTPIWIHDFSFENGILKVTPRLSLEPNVA